MDLALEHLLEQLRALAEQGDVQAAEAALLPLQAADSAALLSEVDPDFAFQVLDRWDAKKQAVVFGYLKPSSQAFIASALPRDQLVTLFEHMDHDKRADVYNQLSETQRVAVLPGLAQAEREDIRQLASYPEDTVGSIMTSSYVTLRADQTVAQALDTVRLEGPDAETIYQAYVLDADRHLIGTISLRDLLLAPAGASVANVMVRDVKYSHVDAPDYEAARMIAHYDILAVPVVNASGQMVGIVTHDDALDVVESESTEDQYRLGAVSGMRDTLSQASIGTLYMRRVGWLVILVFGNLFSGAGIAHFEDLIARFVSLVFFLPLLVDSGGNAGSQSATLMVRALATGDVRAKDWFRLLGKELLVSLLLGLSMAIAVSSIGYWRGGMQVAIIVASTMVLIVIVGSTVGMSLPFLLDRFKMDPASASAPLVTTLCDAMGVLIYFNVATAVFDLT